MFDNTKISEAVLKYIALITMFCDHFAIMFLLAEPLSIIPNSSYSLLRDIGRIAMPIYTFCIAEGCRYTKHKIKYILYLLADAVISMPFFYLMTWSQWNVIFTLMFGAIIIFIWQYDGFANKYERLIIGCISTIGICWIAYILDTDYNYRGVLMVLTWYVFPKKYRFIAALVVYGILMTLFGETWAIIGCLLCVLYNGQRGRQNKYLFYGFYPAHLALLSLARYII